MENFTLTGFTQNGNNSTYNALPRDVRIAYVIILSALMIVICTGNGLFVASYIKSYKKVDFKTNTVYFLVQLAVADMLVGISLPYHAILFWFFELEYLIIPCILRYVTIIFPLAASLLCLFSVTLDRCVAVLKPLEYSVIMTNKKVRISSIVIWMVAVIIGIIFPLCFMEQWETGKERYCDLTFRFKWGYFGVVLLPMLGVASIGIVAVYIIIFVAVFRHNKSQFARLQPDYGTSSNSVQKEKLNLRLLVTNLVVCGIFYLCWMPFFLTFAIQIYGNMTTNKTLSRCRTIASFPAIANSFLNAIIYAWRLPFFNSYLRSLFKCGRSEGLTETTGGQSATKLELY